MLAITKNDDSGAITIGAFVILFAIYAFLSAGIDAARGFSSDRAGPVAGYLLLALLSLAAGLIALLWPGLTALVTGIMEVIMAFREGETAGERAIWALGGLVSIALGACGTPIDKKLSTPRRLRWW